MSSASLDLIGLEASQHSTGALPRSNSSPILSILDGILIFKRQRRPIDYSMNGTTAHSIPSSLTPSAASSIHSQDAKASKAASTHSKELKEPITTLTNGVNNVAGGPVAKKTTMTSRLSRMFSTTGTTKQSKDTEYKDRPKGEALEENPVSGGPGQQDTNGVKLATKLTPPSRSGSYSEKKLENVRKQSPKAPHKDSKDTDVVVKRFNHCEDGTHEHHLKSAKRQEKLSDMLRDMLVGKKKEGHAHGEDQELSLMSTWVDQLKVERERLATDVKGGSNHSATLVQKYGKCQEIVGRGAFGIVRIAHKPDPKDAKMEHLYAVKEFRRRPQESPKKYQKRLTSEFCISSSLRHPNIIHTLDLLQDAKGDYCEVMEFCAGGDLYTLVLAAGKLDVSEADCYFKQLMCGVEYLHEMGVAHRDLKPENLLLTTHGALKITDFGNGECFRMAWESEAHMTAGLCGSAPYIAPEEYVDKEFDPRSVDVWATGVIYMAMRTGRHLWRVAKKDEDEFYERYLEGRRDEDGYGPIETLHRVSYCP